jgi:hypothetical protein
MLGKKKKKVKKEEEGEAEENDLHHRESLRGEVRCRQVVVVVYQRRWYHRV